MGSLYYGSGYLSYYNPYYINRGVGAGYGYNYSQPIPVSYGGQTNANPGTNGSDQLLDSAIAAFRQNDYGMALNITNQALSQFFNDAVLHEFRALVLFATGDYQQSAATIHSVLAVGPGWDWTTMSGIYADIGIYTVQLRALEAAARNNPNDGATRFLLGYHYLTAGHRDAAIRQLQQVVTLIPNDKVAADLLRMTQSQQTNPADNSTAQPTPQPPSELPSPGQTNQPPIDPASIIGIWNASRDDGSKFTLNLAGDGTFKWSFSARQQPLQAFDGTYKLDGSVVALEKTGGGSLVAKITPRGNMGFNFKMVGAPDEDPGLNFGR